MKRLLKMLAGLLGAVACAGVALAGSPVHVVGTSATTGVTVVSAPASGSMGFKLQNVVFGAFLDTTQVVSVVQGTITNQLATKAIAATDRMLAVSNAPWRFAGDSIRVTQPATNSYSILFVGENQN